jgi:hypothetical protein
VNRLLPRNRRTYLTERPRNGATQLTALDPQPDRLTLIGYWQDEAYFSKHEKTIRRELTPPAPADVPNLELGSLFAATDTVFLHVRRVDYRSRLTRDYYQSAIAAAHANIRCPRFAVFGDDLKWPRETLDFMGAPVHMVEHNPHNEIADLWLMTRCRHAIIANSSFSWWGAWLGAEATGGFVLSPANCGFPLRPAPRWCTLPNALEEDSRR